MTTCKVDRRKTYDLRLKQTSYEVDDLVFLLDSGRKIGQSNKLQPIWKGPMIVTRFLTPILYKILGRKKSTVVHHDRLKHCHDRNIPLWLKRKRNQLLQIIDASRMDTVHDNLNDWHLDKLFEDMSDAVPAISQDTDNLDVGLPVKSIESDGDTTKLVTTRAGRESRRPKYLTDYCS